MATGRLGFLLRVLTPGTFQVGDVLTLVDRPHPDVSVASVVRAFRSPTDRIAAAQMSNLARLAPEWRKEFAKRITTSLE